MMAENWMNKGMHANPALFRKAPYNNWHFLFCAASITEADVMSFFPILLFCQEASDVRRVIF
jgi:hypothetical protein